MGARVDGKEHVPRSGAFILASNHISYLDPPLVGCYYPRRTQFFAKQELFDMPIVGSLMRRVKSLPVRRGVVDRRAVEGAVEALKAGGILCVFPEGTRGKEGKFLDPKAGIGKIAMTASVPILPVYIENADKFGQCLVRKRRLIIRYGEVIGTDWIAKQEDGKEGWMNIAQEVMRRIGLVRQSLSSGAVSKINAE